MRWLYNMDISRWSIPKSDWLYSLQSKMEKLYTVSRNKTRSWQWLRLWTPCCQFRLKLKKVGENTRPFRYDLNQILYDYKMEVKNRFMGLDLIEPLKNYGQRFVTLYRRQWSRPIPRKRNAKGENDCLGGLANSWEKKRSKRQRRKGKIYLTEWRVPENSNET